MRSLTHDERGAQEPEMVKAISTGSVGVGGGNALGYPCVTDARPRRGIQRRRGAAGLDLTVRAQVGYRRHSAMVSVSPLIEPAVTAFWSRNVVSPCP
jgi:hypothetical protein